MEKREKAGTPRKTVNGARPHNMSTMSSRSIRHAAMALTQAWRDEFQEAPARRSQAGDYVRAANPGSHIIPIIRRCEEKEIGRNFKGLKAEWTEDRGQRTEDRGQRTEIERGNLRGARSLPAVAGDSRALRGDSPRRKGKRSGSIGPPETPCPIH